MKDFSAAKRILRMRISRDRAQGNLKLSQVQYIERVLQRFNMKNAKPVGSQLANHFKHSKESSPKIEAEKELMIKVPFASAIGSLMYVMVRTGPDLTHAVGVVSKYSSNLRKHYWEVVKWILRYLRVTSDLPLFWEG